MGESFCSEYLYFVSHVNAILYELHKISHCKEQYLAFAVNSLNFNPDLKYLNVFRQLITICKGGNVEPSIHTEVSKFVATNRFRR